MSKPIFIIRIPFLENQTDRDILESHIQKIEQKLQDYHTLAVIENSINEIKFECYNAPHTDIEFEELKNMVLKTIKTPLLN